MSKSSLPAHDANPDASPVAEVPQAVAASAGGQDITRLSDLSAHQWKSGAAAWLGWLFDGLDIHLYTLVATPFVASLLDVKSDDPSVKHYASWIQAAFLVGWAFGGGFFGRLGDRLGRSRALVLTILTYALFTGLSFFAQTWWQLLICRFLAALGIGGEWAVGASLLSETWPRKWGPWIAAVLQSAVNCGVMLACVAGILMSGLPPRYMFLVGIVPAVLVLWIRRAVPETDEWHAAQATAGDQQPSVMDLLRGTVLKTTVLTTLVCALSLTAHWAFTFWSVQHMSALAKADGWTPAQLQQLTSSVLMLIMVTSIVGNFVAGFIAKLTGYRTAIVLMCVAYFGSLAATYGVSRDHASLWYFLPLMGICQGVFGLFTMYLPPLFPTLLRTTGAGFCYNIGRIAAAAGTVFFVFLSPLNDFRPALFYSGFLFLPAAAFALLLSEPSHEPTVTEVAGPLE